MSSRDNNKIPCKSNVNLALTCLLEAAVSQGNKHGIALNVDEEILFPSKKRSGASIEAQTTMGANPPPAPSIAIPSGNNTPSFPFLGEATSPQIQTPAQSQNYSAMMNPQSNPFVAAHAAMSAFIGTQMMGQFQANSTDPNNNNPIQNFMASYASMPNGAVPQNIGGLSTGQVSVPNGSIGSSSLSRSEISRPIYHPSLNKSNSRLSPNRTAKAIEGPNSSVMQNTSISGAPKAIGLPQSLAANPFFNMKNLSLDELEEFVRQLQDANQSIPQPLSMLLTDAQRMEKRKNAKRLANRKSACTSRAKKRAYLEEIEKINKKLRRQALILSLLPDLVVALTSDCEISFISAQVERVLKYDPDDLVGADMMDLLVPASREALRRLVNKLFKSEVIAKAGATEAANGSARKKEQEATHKSARDIDRNNSPPASAGSASASEAVVISEQSFPLSVVQVKNSVKMNEDVGTDGSGNGNEKVAISSITCSHHSSSNSNDSSNNNNSLNKYSANTNQTNKKDSSASDDSSSDSKNLRKANIALNRNVQLHNAKLCKENENNHRNRQQHTDDVTGATVTANNANARLSSLQHRPTASKTNIATAKKKKLQRVGKKTVKNNTASLTYEVQSNSSSTNSLLGVEDNNRKASSNRESSGNNSCDDSGYGEGSDSSRSPSDNEDDNSCDARKPKPLAPTCTVCLVRLDLTTIWCEVTASIRTSTADDEIDELQASTNVQKNNSKDSNKKKSNKNTESDNKQEEGDPTKVESNKKEEKEVLLCLRPLRDGDKVGEESRFDLEASKRKCKEVKENKQLSKSNDLSQKVTAKPAGVDVSTNVSDDFSSSVNSANSSQCVNDDQKQQTKINSDSKQAKGLPLKKRAQNMSKNMFFSQ